MWPLLNIKLKKNFTVGTNPSRTEEEMSRRDMVSSGVSSSPEGGSGWRGLGVPILRFGVEDRRRRQRVLSSDGTWIVRVRHSGAFVSDVHSQCSCGALGAQRPTGWQKQTVAGIQRPGERLEKRLTLSLALRPAPALDKGRASGLTCIHRAVEGLREANRPDRTASFQTHSPDFCREASMCALPPHPSPHPSESGTVSRTYVERRQRKAVI